MRYLSKYNGLKVTHVLLNVCFYLPFVSFVRALECFKKTFPKNKTDCRFNKFHLTTHYCTFIREYGSLHAIDSGHGERQQKLMKKLYKNTTRRKRTAIGELGVRLGMLDSVMHLEEAFGIKTESAIRREGKRKDRISNVAVGKQLVTPIGAFQTVSTALTRGDGWEKRLHRRLGFLSDGQHERASFFLYLEFLKIVRAEDGKKMRMFPSNEAFIARYQGAFWER
jgi:hypothetical protein